MCPETVGTASSRDSDRSCRPGRAPVLPTVSSRASACRFRPAFQSHSAIFFAHPDRFDRKYRLDAGEVHVAHPRQRTNLQDIDAAVGRDEFVLDVNTDDAAYHDSVGMAWGIAGERQ